MTRALGDVSVPAARRGRIVLIAVGALAVFAVALIGIVVTVLGSDLAQTLRELRTARSENPQWSLSHTEIEFLRYRSEIDRTRIEGADSLSDLRQSFDIVYSRLETIKRGQVMSSLRNRADFMAHLDAFSAFLDQSAEIIDGEDARLIARLETLTQLADGVYPDLRRMGLITLENWNTGSNTRRDYLLGLLSQLLVVLGIGLFLLLLALALLVRLALDLQRSHGDLAQAMELAQRRERDKARFLSIMSHEIRNPLNGLLGALNLLSDMRMSPEQAKAVSVMQTCGGLLDDLVNRVLDPDKDEGGLTAVAPRPVDVAALVRAIVDSMQASARLKELDMRVDVARAADHTVMTDPVLLAQTLENLIGNALKFTDAGQIDVTAEIRGASAGAPATPEAELVLVVSDTGRGIAKDRQQQVFDDYHSARSETDRRPSGTGLGLGVVRRIAEALGGEISVESTPGAGSAFRLTCPVRLAQTPKGGAAAPRQRTSMTALNLLVAEDVDFNRMVIETYLREDGHHVTLVEDGAQAVVSCRDTAYDLLVLDVQMPVMDGVAALRRIRSDGGASSRAAAIAITAYAVDDEKEALRAEGFQDVLRKPIDRTILRHAIAHNTAAARSG
ncbi:MAG: ATP-binding protein [Pseudomonadota bacterium]